MKTIDKYVQFKSEYQNYIVIIKSGNFYYSFGDDALILSYLFNYQIRDNRVGFPTNAKAKVKSILNRNNLSIIEIMDTTYVIDTKNNNAYSTILSDAKKNIIFSNMLNNLMSSIEIKLKKEEANYNLIKEFIDEL